MNDRQHVDFVCWVQRRSRALVMTRCEHDKPTRNNVRLCFMPCSYVVARWPARDVHVVQILLFGGGWVRLGAADDCEPTQAIGCAEANFSVVDGRLAQPACV